MEDKKNVLIDMNDLCSDLWSGAEKFEEYLKNGLVDAESLYKTLFTKASNDPDWNDFLLITGETYDYCRILHQYGISTRRIENYLKLLTKSSFGLFIHEWLTPKYKEWKELGLDTDACYLISSDSAVGEEYCVEILIDNISDYPIHLQKPVLERIVDVYPLNEIIDGGDSIYGEFNFMSILIDMGIDPKKIAQKFKMELKYEDARWEDCFHMIYLLENGSGLFDLKEIIKTLAKHIKNNYGDRPEEWWENQSLLTNDCYKRLKALGADPEELESMGIKFIEE